MFQVYGRRFIVLILFCLGNGMNEFMWNCFSPIFSEVSDVFRVSDFAVTFLSLSYMIIFAPASLLFVYIQVRYGLRKTLLIGSSLQAFGGWLRYLGCVLLQTAETDNYNYFAMLMIGQIFCATAQPVFTNIPPLLSATWFPSSERNRATIGMVMANPIGNALGSLVPGFVIPLLSTNPTDTIRQHIKNNLAYFTLGQAILATLVVVGFSIFVPDKPPTPPSAAAAARIETSSSSFSTTNVPHEPKSVTSVTTASTTETESLLDPSLTFLPANDHDRLPGSSSAASLALRQLYHEYKLLTHNKNFLFLLGGFGLGLGTFNALLTLLGQILSPCRYTSTEAGITGGILLGSGLLTSAIVGTYLEKSRALVPVLRVAIILGVIMIIVFLVCLRPGISIALYVTSGVLGAAVVPILPVGLENAAECTYPLSEDTSASALTMTGKYLGVILTFILQPLLSSSIVSDCSTIFTPTAGVILGSLLVSAVCIFRFRKDYRRQQTEKEYTANQIHDSLAG